MMCAAPFAGGNPATSECRRDDGGPLADEAGLTLIGFSSFYAKDCSAVKRPNVSRTYTLRKIGLSKIQSEQLKESKRRRGDRMTEIMGEQTGELLCIVISCQPKYAPSFNQL